MKDVENEITLTGDYRGTIPQPILKLGVPLNKFGDELITIVQQHDRN